MVEGLAHLLSDLALGALDTSHTSNANVADGALATVIDGALATVIGGALATGIGGAEVELHDLQWDPPTHAQTKELKNEIGFPRRQSYRPCHHIEGSGGVAWGVVE